eukprot:TRINITY_DN74728_c0_g1_i1.p1 TRINITY_DN74728_c0_g1~~TRINITY_DN74728_c0_g1_i1.p1  ORF type:complete len:199 (-),score=40.21 TRINITY_DN74728_c0_g1_i1:135-731(-)
MSPAEKVLNCIHQLFQAVRFLQKHGIIHGDIKPCNIVISADDRVRIIDLGGMTRLSEASSKVRKGKIEHTSVYMPPDFHFAASQIVDGDAASDSLQKAIDSLRTFDIYSAAASLVSVMSVRGGLACRKSSEAVRNAIVEFEEHKVGASLESMFNDAEAGAQFVKCLKEMLSEATQERERGLAEMLNEVLAKGQAEASR